MTWQSNTTAKRIVKSLTTWMRTSIFAALNSVSSILLICIISPMKIGELIWQVSGRTIVHGDQNLITVGKTK
jgi:hypothetical protein